jgi:hypothetical protein
MSSRTTQFLDRLAANAAARRALLFASVAAMIGSLLFAGYRLAEPTSAPWERPALVFTTPVELSPLASGGQGDGAPSEGRHERLVLR